MFMCEDCFLPFKTDEQRLDHKDHGVNPCISSCEFVRCRRRRIRSLSHLTHCDHIFTVSARWQAALRTAEAMIHGHTSNNLRNSPSLEQQQQQHTGGESDLTNALSQSSHDTGEVEIGTAQDARDTSGERHQVSFRNPASRVYGFRVTQSEQQLSSTQPETSSAHIGPLEQSQARLQHLLATACHELLAAGSPSLRVGASFRNALSVDAPNILAEIERIPLGTVRAPINTNQTHGAWHHPSVVSEFASNSTNHFPFRLASPAQVNDLASTQPLAPFFPEQDTGTIPTIDQYGGTSVVPMRDSTMLQLPSDRMQFHRNPSGTAASANLPSAMYPMPTQPDSATTNDYYSQSSGGHERSSISRSQGPWENKR